MVNAGSPVPKPLSSKTHLGRRRTWPPGRPAPPPQRRGWRAAPPRLPRAAAPSACAPRRTPARMEKLPGSVIKHQTRHDHHEQLAFRHTINNTKTLKCGLDTPLDEEWHHARMGLLACGPGGRSGMLQTELSEVDEPAGQRRRQGPPRPGRQQAVRRRAARARRRKPAAPPPPPPRRPAPLSLPKIYRSSMM